MLLKHVLEQNGGHKKEKLGIKAKLLHLSVSIVEMSEKNSRSDKQLKFQMLHLNLLLSNPKSWKIVLVRKWSNYIIFMEWDFTFLGFPLDVLDKNWVKIDQPECLVWLSDISIIYHILLKFTFWFGFLEEHFQHKIKARLHLEKNLLIERRKKFKKIANKFWHRKLVVLHMN